jgi:phage baseplate assembly protein W
MSDDEREAVEADRLIGWRTVAAMYQRLADDGIDVATNQMLADAAVTAIRQYEHGIRSGEVQADPTDDAPSITASNRAG